LESQEIVGRFSIDQADKIEAVARLDAGCPLLLIGGSVDARCLAGDTLED